MSSQIPSFMRTFSVVQPPPTPDWPNSSSSFATTVVVEAGTSLALLGYWWGGHGLALLSVLLQSWPMAVRLLALAGLASHAWLARPRAPRRVVVGRDGLWTVPEWGVVAQPPRRGSVRTPWIIRVHLAGPPPRTLWLARDSMPRKQWRRLQVLLNA